MKKSILILFSLFYLSVTSGVTINWHYCGGKLKSTSFFDSKNEKGCCGNKKKSKDCCNEKTTSIKVKDNHYLGTGVSINHNYFKSIDIPFSKENFELPKENAIYSILNYHAPPPVLYDNPLYLKNKVLLI